ncbi:MAG: transcriptional repressor [Bacteroidetes bacterium]|nr:transcriptional repressor [Bacteroidota bacterium]MBU1115892.1 transcriptional repressor [Bacteroidota bacterium]MBU1798749.1 transcriptional repressor [Bacteroidota bacterium]
MTNIEKINSKLNENFAEKGFRLTAPRKAVLSILSQNMNHPTVEEIYLQVHENYPSIGMMTVYRTLDLLVEWGVVHKFDFSEGKARYELIDHPDGIGHHHHLICHNCKKIINYTDFIDEEFKFITKLEKQLSKKHKFQITKHIIEFYGVCDSCVINN